MRRLGGIAAALWALGGVSLLLLFAAVRLGRRGIETVQAGLGPVEWTGLILLVLLFVVGEGWGALQRKWVPRVVERAVALRRGGPLHFRILAPLYGMSLIGGCARSLARAWAGTFSIVVAVLIVRTFPDPWRGIVDLAVASALVWGVAAIVAAGGKAFTERREAGAA
ncbi:MAG: hypothetical protein JSU98_02345 [Gemmatimonadales bacterium]|nr:MAG: hypothetical protein JSU98_02345 [Gemmatimonadales bacterium]